MTHDDPQQNLLARKLPVATWADPTRGAPSDETQLYIDWGAEGWGWGTLNFYTRDGVLHCDNECMSRRFCKTVLERLVAEIGREPALLRLHGSIDALLTEAVPLNPAPDWPAP